MSFNRDVPGPRSTLAEVTVIIGRAPDQVTSLAAQIGNLGGRPIALPLIEVTIQMDPETSSCLGKARDCDLLVATSANALRALWNVGQNYGIDFPSTCYVVGKTSVTEAHRLGFQAHSFPGVRTGEELATWLAETLPERQTIFYPHGNLASERFANILCEAGHEVVRCECYRTSDAKVNVGDLESFMAVKPVVLILYSPSAVASLHRQWHRDVLPPEVQIVCVGPTTEAACHELGYSVSCVANTPTEEGVLEAVLRTLNR